MTRKKTIWFALFALILASCAGANSSYSTDDTQPYESPSFSSSSATSAREEADLNGFDPNFNYVGSSATDFKIIASRYVANPDFVAEPCFMEDYYIKTVFNFGIISFPFRGSSIVAYYRGDEIIEVHRFESGKLTIGEARSLGYVGETQANQHKGYVYFRSGGKPSSTKRYERKLDQSLGGFAHREDVVSKYIDLFKKYGIPTSMLVYYDGEADDYIHDMEGDGYLGLSVNYASAIPVYSDDLSDVVGAMTIGYCSGSLRKAFTYLKEDGFGEIKKVKEILNQVSDPEIEEMRDPRFYVEDTSLLPKGDWRIILGNGR